MAYNSYRDIRGPAAKPVSVAMGIDEPSQFSHTGYLVEVREAPDHIRLSAHATTYSREVLVFNNRNVEIIDLDSVAKEARKTVFESNGTITSSRAPWSVEANGFTGPYKVTEKLTGQTERASAEWEKYDGLIMAAEVKASGTPAAPSKNRRDPPPAGLIV